MNSRKVSPLMINKAKLSILRLLNMKMSTPEINKPLLVVHVCSQLQYTQVQLYFP